MRKREGLLIDAVYRATFGKKRHPGWSNNADMRAALRDANRFMLDDRMSAFLGDLATASFVTKDGGFTKTSHALIDQMRTSARLPHRTCWFEYNLRAELKRSDELMGRAKDLQESPDREAWLLRQHPTIETAFSAMLFNSCEALQDGIDFYTFPVAYVWTTDDSPLPWKALLPPTMPGRVEGTKMYMPEDGGIQIPSSSLCTGMYYDSEHVNVAVVRPGCLEHGVTAPYVVGLLKEWTGVMRRMWALLATINDIPVTHKSVSVSKGFVARGSYHKFLERKVITLTVPETRDMRVLARTIVAAARRRAHQVRGFWRRDWRKPLRAGCLHEFSGDNVCSHCGGHRIWVHEHQRGDASLGFVTHDYSIQHPTES